MSGFYPETAKCVYTLPQGLSKNIVKLIRSKKVAGNDTSPRIFH